MKFLTKIIVLSLAATSLSACAVGAGVGISPNASILIGAGL